MRLLHYFNTIIKLKSFPHPIIDQCLFTPSILRFSSCFRKAKHTHFNIYLHVNVVKKEVAKRQDLISGDKKAFQGETWEFFEEFREKKGQKEMFNAILPKIESLSDFKYLLGRFQLVLYHRIFSGI